MDIFNGLTMLGGLCLFLFGMSIMGKALERRAGSRLRTVLSRMTTNKLAGFLTGCGVTAVIQSSSATTVMVVGFVNSGLMTLHQAVNVIMGANVGTTITGWILSLGGISGDSTWVRLLKPSSFTPVLAFIGIIYYMFCKKTTKKDTGMILLGFATLMYGMETMTGAVSGLSEVPAFRDLFLMFKHPLLGLLAGAVLTAVIQSSSASVGILQALAMTGVVSYGAAIPIVMGDAIGTCVTAMLSSVGAKKEAKRAAVVHLAFNLIGALVWITVYSIIRVIFAPDILDASASLVGIAVVNTAFKVLSTALLLPMSSVLEKIAELVVPSAKTQEETIALDERLLASPHLALEQSRRLAIEMAETAVASLNKSIQSVTDYSPQLAEEIREEENACDKYEDVIGTYLIKVSAKQLGVEESEEITALLKSIGDFERISDHAVNILESAEELQSKKLSLSEEARRELGVITAAVSETLTLAGDAFIRSDVKTAATVEPLEQVVDDLKERLRTHHILRMKEGKCTVEAGFVWSDLLTNLERVSDHCSNIAGCVIDRQHLNLNLHESLNAYRKSSEEFEEKYRHYQNKYFVG